MLADAAVSPAPTALSMNLSFNIPKNALFLLKNRQTLKMRYLKKL